eukprot:scaffold54390_cov22-Tisochrysis_lutea.AAC.6
MPVCSSACKRKCNTIIGLSRMSTMISLSQPKAKPLATATLAILIQLCNGAVNVCPGTKLQVPHVPLQRPDQ